MTIDSVRFQAVYKQSIQDVSPFFGRFELELIAKHNPAWGPDHFDFAAYLEASEVRYLNAIRLFNRHNKISGQTDISVLDVGGFMAAFPLALVRSGVQVTLAEKYSYYSGAFNKLEEFLVANGIEVRDEDFSEQAVSARGEFDLVTNMAVLEHLASSPKCMVDNLKNCLKPTGKLILEVPNIAYWPKRIQLLRGQTVHPDFQTLYSAATPFIGHHREYTIDDLKQLASLSQLHMDELISFNYTPWLNSSIKQKLFLKWPTRVFRSCREVLMAILSL